MKLNICALLVGFIHLAYCGMAQQFAPNFQPFITRPGDVQELRLLPDGRFVIAGNFSLANRLPESNVARFLPDGTLDQSFQATLDFSVSAMDVQVDGKVVIGGQYTGPDAPEGLAVLRLNSDGSLDQSFQAASLPSGDLNDIAVEANGNILVGGAFSELNGQPAQGLVRLNGQGQLLQTFTLSTGGSAFVSELVSQPDGRFIIAGTRNGEGFVSYREANGQEVPGFNFSADLPEANNYMTSVRDIALDPQGRIVLTASTFLIRYAVVVLDFDGSLLNTDSFISVPMDLAVNASGDILVAGELENVNAVHRYLPGQGLDIYALGDGADGLIRVLRVNSSGQMLVGGRFSAFNGQAALGLEQLEASGQPSNAFSPAVERPGIVRSLVRYDDNRVCIGGDFARVGERELVNVARLLLSDGSADPNFTNPGLYYRNQVNHIALDAQGRLLAAGTNNNDGQSLPESPILRLLPNGAIDQSFLPNPLPVGTVSRIQPLGNGQSLAMGNFAIFNNGLVAIDAAVYNTDGSVDEAFSDRFGGKLTECFPDAAGGFILAGRNIRYDGSAATTLLRLTPDFELDPNFQAPGALGCRGDCAIRLSELDNGQLLVGGPIVLGSDTSLIRLQADGTHDPSFSLGATFYREDEWVDASPTALQVLENGDILATGRFTALGNTELRGMVRLSPDGSVQDALTLNSFERQQLNDALLLSGERVLLAGELSGASGTSPRAVAIADLMTAPVANPTISGYIRTWQGEPMGQVEVALSGSQNHTTFTDSTGFYQFDQLQEGGSYTVSPRYDIGHANGVSLMDVILINKHILGVQPFSDPYELLAADANNSGAVTTLDMIALQRLILGMSTSFSAHTSWRFIPADYFFADPANPWLSPPPGLQQLSSLPAEGVDALDFFGIKIGDPSGNAVAP